MSQLSRLRFIDTERTRMPVRQRLRSRGVPNALQDHEVLCSDDVEAAEDAASALLGAARLRVAPGDRAEFQATLNAVQVRALTMAYLDFRAPATLSVAPADVFTIHTTTHASGQAVVGGRRCELSAFRAVVTSPGVGYVVELGADCPQMIIRLERAAVERQLSRMLGRSLTDPIAFLPTADLTRDAAVRWHGAMHLLSSEVMTPASLTQRGIGAGAIEELVVSTLLYLQPSNYSDGLSHAGDAVGHKAVRRCLEYIDGHLAEPITLADLARHAQVSVRSVQTGFREDLDTTPVGYIRDRRLDAVRGALMEALPSDGVTVAQLAERWHFANAGSFAVRYRKRFGESPSATLRR